jgi:hypothetical protein
VSRWEKVFKRLTLLNKYHPLKTPYNCRALENSKESDDSSESKEDKIFFKIREALVSEDGVFFGGFAASLYSKIVKKTAPIAKNHPPSFDVIVENPEKCATIIKERLADIGVRKVKIIKHENLEDVIPEHIQVIVENKTVAFLFKPIACYNYNEIEMASHKIKVATIDTMLSFYLAFAYSGEPYFNVERILCMAQFLFDIEEENRLNRRGLLKRFSANCYGEQATLASMRAEKSNKFKELVAKGVKKDSPEWNEWFFKYSPAEKFGDKKETSEEFKGKRGRKRTYRKKFSFFRNNRSRRNRLF